MISVLLKAQRWPQLDYLSVYVPPAGSQETATRLINKKAKDLSEQRLWHFTERNTCTISSTGSFSYISFPLHQSHRCACTASAWLNSGCELFILFKSIGANTYFFLSYTSCTYSKCAPHQIWPQYTCSSSQRTHESRQQLRRSV